MKSAAFVFFALAVSLVNAQSITCETQQSACDEQIGANHACCAALYASCAAGSTTPDSPFNQCSNGPPCPTCTATVPAATASTVSSACAAQFTLCKTQVGENSSCCAALQASCLAGTVSPESDVSQCSNGPPCPTCTVVGSGSTTPSSTTPSSTTTSAATSSASSIASACAIQFTACKTQVGENNACCAALQSTCLSGLTSPSADVSQCSNGPPCSTCTVSGAAYGSGSMSGYSSPTTSPVASTTSVTVFTGAADAHRGAGRVFAFGLAVAVMF